MVLNVQAQYTSKKIRSKHEIYTDSLKKIDYPYIFPILGQGAYSKGYDIPYPAGVMGNFMWMRQGIYITNLQLGLKTKELDIPLTPVGIIDFGDNINTSYTLNARPDLWIFPFLNVYGIFGWGQTHTEVNLVKPIHLQSIVEQNISTAGVGMMTAFGIGPVWLSADVNWTWNKPELLDKPVNVNVLGLRLGHTFTFKQKPTRNIALWVGTMYAKMSSETKGEIKLSEALPAETWEKTEEIVANYWDWYDNEATIKEKVFADKILTPIVDKIEAADGSSVIRYGMDKQVKKKWNMIVGAQFQMNKKWMLRMEGGIIGDRKSALLSLNYRFLM